MLNRISTLILTRFPLFIVGYFILQVIVRLLTTKTVVIDESEQVMLSQFLALGYNSQPPLYTWVQKALFHLLGENILAITLLKNATLMAVYLFTYKACQFAAKDREKAALSAFGILFLPQLIWEAQIDQIHTVLLTASAAALFYAFFYTVVRRNLTGFLLLGVVCGCGVLAKYNFVVVIAALLLSALAIREYREIILCRRLLLSIVIAVLLPLPHFLWFFNHLGLATTETLDRMHVDKEGGYLLDILHGSGELVLSYLAFTVIFLVFFFLFFGRKIKLRRNAPANLLLLYTIATFFSVVIVILITRATNIKERWLQPYLFLTPMLMFVLADFRTIDRRRIKGFLTTGLVFCAVVLLVIPFRVFFVDISKKPHRENYPFTELAKQITQAGFDHGLILAEDKFVGGNLKLLFQDSTVITPSIPLQPFSPATKTLVVWKDQDPIAFLKGADLGTSSGVRQISAPFTHSKKFTCTYHIELFTASVK